MTNIASGNHLFYGDNLDVLRTLPGECVDLIYLDPPFNSNASYNVLFKNKSGEQSPAQIEAFDDTWEWGASAEQAFEEVMQSGHAEVATMLQAMRSFLGANDMLAYLVMMAVRLIELHRVLKPTGSLYLHCDPTASHYLKILLDAVFGPKFFKNEIIWRRTGSHNKSKRYGPIHDVILFYSRSESFNFKTTYRPYLLGHVASYFKSEDEKGKYWTNALTGAGVRGGESGAAWKNYEPTSKKRHWAIPGKIIDELGINPELGTLEKLNELYSAGFVDLPNNPDSMPSYRQYLHTSPGMPLQDIWSYQPHTKGCLYNTNQCIDEDVRWLSAQGDPERLGYPTQKPVGLLERIIKSSSREGDVVLDPFCGCGTTVHAAQKLGRRWIGIDVTHLAIGLIERRLREAFPAVQFTTHGVPQDVGGAAMLADRDKYEFQKWALSLVAAAPFKGGQKGADGGIDGTIFFKTSSNTHGKAIVSVKGGKNVGVTMVRDLASVVEKEKAQVGVFITLTEPTSVMEKEAVATGFYKTEFGNYPKIQILTIADLLNGKRPQLPVPDAGISFKKAAKEESESRQKKLL